MIIQLLIALVLTLNVNADDQPIKLSQIQPSDNNFYTNIPKRHLTSINETIPPILVQDPLLCYNTTLLNASNSNFTMFGKGELPISYVEADFQLFVQLISKFKTTNSKTKPIIYYYVDEQIEIVAYALAYSYSSSLFQIYEIVKIMKENALIYVGKQYLPALPSEYWQAIPFQYFGEIQYLTSKFIKSNETFATLKVNNLTVSQLKFLEGTAYFTVFVDLENGYVTKAGYLRHNVTWFKICEVYVDSSLVKISSPSIQTNSTGLKALNFDQIQADNNLTLVLNEAGSTMTLMTVGFKISKVQRETFFNETIITYKMIYASTNPNHSLLIKINFNFTSNFTTLLELKNPTVNFYNIFFNFSPMSFSEQIFDRTYNSIVYPNSVSVFLPMLGGSLLKHVKKSNKLQGIVVYKLYYMKSMVSTIIWVFVYEERQKVLDLKYERIFIQESQNPNTNGTGSTGTPTTGAPGNLGNSSGESKSNLFTQKAKSLHPELASLTSATLISCIPQLPFKDSQYCKMKYITTNNSVYIQQIRFRSPDYFKQILFYQIKGK